MLRKNKRGDVTDILFFSLIIFVFAIILFVFTFIIPEIAEGLETAGMNNTPEGASGIEQLESFGSDAIQRGFFLFFVGLIISTLISSFLVRVHPIFMFLYIIVLGLTVFVGGYLANAYDKLRQTEIFADQLASQSLINIVMENYVIILIVVGILSLVIAFSKFSSLSIGGSRQRL